MSINPNEIHLIEVCQEIGNVSGCSCHFTGGLLRKIEATGKTVEELTVAELLNVIRDHSDFYNRIYSGRMTTQNGETS